MPAASLLHPAVSANRAPPRASVSDESGLADRRRWTSFLTWAFVLSEMAGRDGWLPTAAHAAEEDVGRAGHAGSDTAPIVNNLPTISVSTATEGPESITYQYAATMPAYAPTGLSSELAEAKIAPAVESTASGHAAGGGGGGHAGDAATDADATGAHVSLGDAPFLAFGQDGGRLDLGLRLDLGDAVHGLLGGVADGLGNLPLVGDLIDNVGSADQQQQAATLVPFHHQSYIVRVKLDKDEVHKKIGDFTPTPGMPADIYIKTGERTFFEYMMRPVLDSFSRAFREH